MCSSLKVTSGSFQHLQDPCSSVLWADHHGETISRHRCSVIEPPQHIIQQDSRFRVSKGKTVGHYSRYNWSRSHIPEPGSESERSEAALLCGWWLKDAAASWLLLLIWSSISGDADGSKSESLFQMWELLSSSSSSSSSSSHLQQIWAGGRWREVEGEIWQLPSKRRRRRGDDLVPETQQRTHTELICSLLRIHQDRVRQDEDGGFVPDEDGRRRRVDAVSSSHVLLFCSGECRWLWQQTEVCYAASTDRGPEVHLIRTQKS